MMFARKTNAAAILAVAFLSLSLMISPVSANQLKYVPVSPSFGGDPYNPEWTKFNTYAQNRTPSQQSGGTFDLNDINLPDFGEMFKDFTELPTIIIPVF